MAFADQASQAFQPTPEAGFGPTEDAQTTSWLESVLDGQDPMTLEMDERRRQGTLVKQLYTEYLWAKQERERYLDRLWNELYRMYREQMPDERQSGEWRSKINVPNIWNAVEAAVPHMMEGLFANDQPFRLKSSADDELVQGHQNLINWELNEVMHIEGEWERHQRQKCLYGTSAWYTGFRVDYEDRAFWSVVQNPDPSAPMEMQIAKKHVPIYVGPTGKCLDIYNIYPHPRSTPDDISWVFVVQFLSYEDMKAAKRFKNLDKLPKGAVVTAPNLDTFVGERRIREGSMNQSMSLVAEQLYPIVTKYDDRKRMIYSFDLYSDVLIEETPYPFFHGKMPIVFDRVTTLPHEFWGVGFAEPILSLAHETNSIRNMRRDNENLVTNAMMEVKEGEIDDEQEELVVRPGGIIHSVSGNATRFMQPPDLPDSYQAEQLVKSDIDRTTGLSGPVVGEAAAGVSSASGNSLLQKAQLLRLRRSLKNECECFKQVVSQILALNCQFMPLPEIFEVLGPLHFGDYSALDVASLSNNATVIVEPAGIYEDENLQRQQYTNLINVLGQPTFSQYIDWKAMLKKVILLNGVSDPDTVMMKPAGINVMQSMMAAQENEAMAQGNQIAPATPDEDYDTHMSIHKTLGQLRPELWQLVGTHMYSHDQVREQQIMQQTALQVGAQGGGAGPANGPGSAPAGNNGGQGGRPNPNRQPAATNQLGLARQQARQTPSGGRS